MSTINNHINETRTNKIIEEGLIIKAEVDSKKLKKFTKEEECKNCEDNDYNHNSQKRIKSFGHKFVLNLKISKNNKKEEKKNEENLRKNQEDIQCIEEIKKIENNNKKNEEEVNKEKEKQYESIRQKYSQDLDMNLKKQLFWVI